MSNAKLFVGNLSYSSTEESLTTAFSQFGEVVSLRIVTDRDTGRSKGFAFVEMANAEAAQTAIQDLDGKQVDGRPISVKEARPREDNRPRGGGGGGGRFRGGR